MPNIFLSNAYLNMTPYRIAVVDDLERDRAWLAKKLADYMARERLEYAPR